MGYHRQEYWSGLPFSSPGGLPNSGIEPMSPASSALASGFFTTSTTWEALFQAPREPKISWQLINSVITEQKWSEIKRKQTRAAVFQSHFIYGHWNVNFIEFSHFIKYPLLKIFSAQKKMKKPFWASRPLKKKKRRQDRLGPQPAVCQPQHKFSVPWREKLCLHCSVPPTQGLVLRRWFIKSLLNAFICGREQCFPVHTLQNASPMGYSVQKDFFYQWNLKMLLFPFLEIFNVQCIKHIKSSELVTELVWLRP